MLPTDYKARKDLPLYDFLTSYFPDAIVEMVKVSVAGNLQHGNPGDKIRWDRTKSMDQLNTAMRHIFDHGAGATYDQDGTMHLAKAAWRLLAEAQLICERRAATALKPPGAGVDQGQGCGVISPDRLKQFTTPVIPYGETNKCHSLSAPGQVLRAAEAPVSDRGHFTRPERAEPRVWEWDANGKSEGPSCGPSQVPEHR